MSNPYVKHYSQNGRRYKERIDRHTGKLYRTIKPICFVPVVDKSGIPLMPTSSKRCTELLSKGKARVYKMYPIFTIQMIDRRSIDSSYQAVSVGIDPGSKYTGIAVTRDTEDDSDSYVIKKMQIDHRGHKITEDLIGRRSYRRTRRNRKTRYREPRFLNRKRDEGWVPPSLVSRTDNIVNHVKKLTYRYPILQAKVEDVKFDIQKILNENIQGKEYQVKLLKGTTVNTYLKLKHNYTCQYCGTKSTSKKKVRLETDHVIPVSKGGSNQLTNLTLACHICNRNKGALSVVEYLTTILKRSKREAAATYVKIREDCGKPYVTKEASIVQSMKTRLYKGLKELGLDVTIHDTCYTYVNRTVNGIAKSHANDAACVGKFKKVHQHDIPTLHIQAMGRGSYQRFTGYVKGKDGKQHPRHRGRFKEVEGFHTGDIVMTDDGIKGRVTITADKQFIVTPITKESKSFKRSYRKMKLLYRNDGYLYSQFRE